MHENTVVKAKNVLYQFLKSMREIDSLVKNIINLKAVILSI